MAAKFLQMNGTYSETPDPKWDTKKAIELGLIPGPSTDKGSNYQSGHVSIAQILHERDCRHAMDTGSNTNVS